MSKVKRKIIKIDEERCTGCGECVLSCAEGAIVIKDGKAKVVKDMFCDGLGACLGHCPENALSIEEREADPFDEEAAMEHVEASKKRPPQACSSSRPMMLMTDSKPVSAGDNPSQLRNWPIQLHLAPLISSSEYVGMPRALAKLRITPIFFSMSAPTLSLALVFARKAKAGMLDSGTTSRGFIRCARCHSSE